MRAKKWLSFITLGSSLVALLTTVAVGNISGGMVYDIALAVFGSALLGFIMSLIEYMVERRHAMETFWDEARKAVSLLRSIKYIDLDAPAEMILACFQEERANAYSEMLDSPEAHSAKDALIGWFEENQPMNWTEEDDISAELDRIYTSRMHSYRDSFMRCIESCVSIADIDLGPLGNAYGSLDFMFANACVRKPAFERIYNKILEYRNLVKEEEYHFRQLINGQGNFPVCAKKAYMFH